MYDGAGVPGCRPHRRRALEHHQYAASAQPWGFLFVILNRTTCSSRREQTPAQIDADEIFVAIDDAGITDLTSGHAPRTWQEFRRCACCISDGHSELEVADTNYLYKKVTDTNYLYKKRSLNAEPMQTPSSRTFPVA
jgi:hypothetical protein